VFGWDSVKPAVQFNQLVITQEELEQIRALRDKPNHERKNNEL
jgi:hypothetical protein